MIFFWVKKVSFKTINMPKLSKLNESFFSLKKIPLRFKLGFYKSLVSYCFVFVTYFRGITRSHWIFIWFLLNKNDKVFEFSSWDGDEMDLIPILLEILQQTFNFFLNFIMTRPWPLRDWTTHLPLLSDLQNRSFH